MRLDPNQPLLCHSCRELRPRDDFNKHFDGSPGATCRSCREARAAALRKLEVSAEKIRAKVTFPGRCDNFRPLSFIFDDVSLSSILYVLEQL